MIHFRRKTILKERLKRPFSTTLLLALLFQLGFPTASMALTSGPSQPEVQSFEPVGTSQMVDPFSGDFTYNIPLLNVEDYPINISYHSGIGMDQEASWVGLGWNINPGVINRGMRGIPDDFKGESIYKEFNMKPNRTYGLTLGVGFEVLGYDKTKKFASFGGAGFDYTVRFNNYTGVGIDRSLTGHIPLSKAASGPLSGNLGITSSSDNGLTIQPNVSYAARIKETSDYTTKMNLSIGTAFNSRGGLQHLTCGVGISRSFSETTTKKTSQFNKGASSTYNLGMPTYTPELTLPFTNFSISASFKWGPQLEGVNPYGRVAGYYSCQKLTQSSINLPAYGYINADEGVKYDNALMDFNREKDGAFTPNTPGLAVPNFTYDILSVSGQGIGGSYRPFRSDFGQIFDPLVSNGSTSASVGGELGVGSVVKVGVDIAVNNVNSQSGRWNNSDGSNAAHANNSFTQTKSSDPLYERYYYKEANEKSVDADPTYLQRAGGLTASNYKLNQVSSFNTKLTSNFTSGQAGASGTRTNREKRSQSISMLTRGEIGNYGLTANSDLYRYAPSYHNAEITSTTADGRRYVYGIAAYNTKQEETTFAVGTDEFGNGGDISGLNCNNGLISYNHIDNSTSNKLGIDNYFTNTVLPPYAHSYLLTSVLSPDYVDSDTIRGPSVNDLGTYTKFNYTKTDSLYRWRIPFEGDHASHNEGLKWTRQDDKASYTYGEKEQWYLTSIETKNYVALFQLEDRKDGFGVTDKNGGRSSSHTSKLLRKISLYTRVNYEAHAANSSIALIPLREVHFEYDYSRCPSVPNNSGATEMVNGFNINDKAGKLTLRKISFSYQSSGKARLSPYTFEYSNENPAYNIKGYDRWGNFKPQDSTVTSYNGCDPLSTGLSNAEFPYVEQNKTKEDSYASAWCLTQIGLPSGGLMQVDYESDDYAYVQNRRAGQMFKIVGVSSNKTSPNDTSAVIYNTSLTDNSYLVIKLQNTITGSDPDGQFREKYLKGLDYIYFRFLYNMSNPGSIGPIPNGSSTFEYVPGYIQTSNIYESGVYPGGQYAYIRFNSVHINDNSLSAAINPITKAALQFGRLNEAKNMWQAPGVTSSTSFGAQLLKSFIQSSFIKNIADAVEGPNRALFTNHNCCQSFMLNKSWIRLNNPNMHKLGGGCRVKKISVADKWDAMTSNAMPSFSYGQEYFYENEDGSSSGVASYEPQLGGDENSLHTPVFFDAEKLLAPDDENYLEEPFGESFFPSPSVGYGRVTVQNIKYSGVTKHASGKVVHEFYTAKDFPTVTDRSGVDAIREKTDPLSLSSFLQINVKDYMTASQGYYIELNDMHGKPKAQEVYQEGVSTPISSIEYVYKSSPYLNGSYRLDNTAEVISPSGTVSSKNVGIFFDFVTDFREQKTNTIGGSINYNTDVIYIIIGTLSIPTVWPGINKEETRFRSAVSSKVVQRFGLIDKVIAKDLGSTVETQNLAYDSETGEVILTQTKTDYNDPLYSLKFPAYWYYDGMGPAYKNIGLTLKNVSYSNSTGVGTVTNASQYFTPGDELEMDRSGDSSRVWVTAVGSNSITLRNKAGGKPSTGSYEIKVIRSGRRNMQMENMASITTLQNPLTSLNNNQYQKVIAASGVEFNDQWSAFCDCTSDLSPSYATGLKGNWRPVRSFAYLTNRTQSNYDNNTNTRIDGVFTSFNPLYKKSDASWQFDTVNWTFTSLVTKINPNGQELENKDALGRYSAATYGYKQTLATAVGANAMYRDLGFDNVEEYGSQNCADNHFKFNSPHIDSTQSHTGRRSIKVTAGSPLVMTKSMDIGDCAPASNVCQITMSGGTSITGITRGPGGHLGGGGSTVAALTFSGTGAVTPLTISWVVNEGNPVVSTSGSTLSIVNSTSLWEITITVTGATGCTQQFTISNN